MPNQLPFGPADRLDIGLRIRPGTPCPIRRVNSWILEYPLSPSAGSEAWPSMVGGTIRLSATTRMLCIGPADWLVVGDPSCLEFAVVELSAAFAHVEFVGERIEELLPGVCGLELHVAAFAPDTCARTRMAGIAVVLERHSVERWLCYVHRSYLLAVLRESGRGMTTIPVS